MNPYRQNALTENARKPKWPGRVVFAGVFAVFACHPLPILNPATGPGTGFPCGTQGQSCGNHMCCQAEIEDCGGGPFNGCPAGYCCYNGDDTEDNPNSFGRKLRMHAMHTEAEMVGKSYDAASDLQYDASHE